MYFRYVDDTFLLVNDEQEANNLLRTFEDNSVLKFTIEYENNHTLPFLDVNVHRSNNLSFKQYHKPTASN